MTNDFVNLVRAELFMLRKRSATWVLLGIWVVVTCVFAYILPYAVYLSGSDSDFGESIESLLPASMAVTIADGMPFYGGSLALVLGVLVVGSEYGWNTWKTLLTQRPGRLRTFGAKISALGLMLVPFVLAAFAIGAVASTSIALLEGASIAWPGAMTLLNSMVSGWLILAVWASFGVFLAMATRGTSMAIGIGILWGLALEGLLSAFAASVSWLEWVVDFLFRANGYSLLRAVNDGGPQATPDGPGMFSGPYVSGTQSVMMLAMYLVVFLGVSAWLLRRRDIA
jgi:ABC-type transport system involved in multi-copper enzyme maturation permease subunit